MERHRSVQPEQLVLPIIATAALGAAMILPARGRLRREPAESLPNRKPLSLSRFVVAGTVQTREWKRLVTRAIRELKTFYALDDASDTNKLDGEVVALQRSFENQLADLLPSQAMGTPRQTRAPVDPIRAAPRSYVPAVPLTRSPLRAATASVLWPNLIQQPALCASRAERHSLMKTASPETHPDLEVALLGAYREEDETGRLLALGALVRLRLLGARAALLDALRAGGDNERVFAVDAFHSLGDREALKLALHDRLDAIAARAALGLVASDRRVDYVSTLEADLEPHRIDAILRLLGGVVQ
jgi:hypothetical protein